MEANVVTIPALVAGADLTAAQYRFVKLDASGDVILCDTAGEQALGVLMNKPNTGEPARVAVAGVMPVVADAAVAVGSKVATSADGEAAVRDEAAGSRQVVLGLAIKGASAAGEQIALVFDAAGEPNV